MFQWLYDSTIRGFYTYTYPMSFNKVFACAHSWNTTANVTPTIDAMAVYEVTNTSIRLWSSGNKPINYLLIWGT